MCFKERATRQSRLLRYARNDDGEYAMNHPKIMGVINVTPDSFYAASRADSVDAALKLAERMVSEGADIIDMGSAATSPNLGVNESQVSAQAEIDRVAPVVEAIAKQFDIEISVDTSKPAVMRAAVAAGATMINDQRALRLPGALEAAAELNVPVCLMHMYGLNNHEMDGQPLQDTLDEIKTFLDSIQDFQAQPQKTLNCFQFS